MAKETTSQTSYAWVLKEPRITEKAALLSDKAVYTFIIDNRANKQDVKKAIQEKYGKSPAKVNVMNVKGKKLLRRTGIGFRSDRKKAMVTMAKGETLEIF